ncbi:hypothetical protein A6R68_17084 [Neotoma lepida]|uniref:BTB domain-containing protein n=1 Tax=Neotoma lepida TaxID=56216 RepID=A0A1A6HEV9_NEOLE|nr:hypothetical protein A6R68_17084 [Neotoma lepida]
MVRVLLPSLGALSNTAPLESMESRKLISATDIQYSGSLLNSLNEQRDHGLFCDVTVIVEDRKFRAHRNILSASNYEMKKIIVTDSDDDDDVIFCSEILPAKENLPSNNTMTQVQSNPAPVAISENQQTPNNAVLTGNKATEEEEEEIIDDDDVTISSSPDSAVSNTSLVPQADTSKSTTFDGSLTQKMQTPVLLQEPPSNSLKISDVITRNTNDPGLGSKHLMEGQKIITLDTATEIEGLSTGCKVYANIGEDTYDIVIPVKDDPDEGEAKLENELPKTSGSEPSNKRMKLPALFHEVMEQEGGGKGEEDHYANERVLLAIKSGGASVLRLQAETQTYHLSSSGWHKKVALPELS